MLVLQQTETETVNLFRQLGGARMLHLQHGYCCDSSISRLAIHCCESSMASRINVAIPAWPPFAAFVSKGSFCCICSTAGFAAFASRSDCFAAFATAVVLCCNSSTPNLRTTHAANITLSLGGLWFGGTGC